jgi:16S rRNA (guanine(966)-N(2))-methyltransferase RsmD
VRKAIFDCLGDFTKGASVLELFAGSAAVGIEAVSRGAKEVVFVDSKRSCLSQIRANLESLGITAYQIYEKDSQKALDFFAGQNSRFDIIFFDPPYGMDLAKKTLLKVQARGILHPLGILIAQHHRKEELPERCGSLMLFKQKRYGDTLLSFYEETRLKTSLQ